MSIESEHDRAGLLGVGRVVRRVLAAMRRQVRAGAGTAELNAIARRVLDEQGARHAPRLALGFPGDCCISINDEAVHGIPGDRILRPGDVVKLDVVAEKDGYHADAAVTVAVPPVAPETRALLDCVHAAFARATRVARAGNRVRDIGLAVESEVRRRGFSVLRDLAGHGVGRAIHELPSVPNHYDPGAGQLLTEGLVLAVEPIVAVRSSRIVQGADGWTLRTALGDLSAHHEHTLIITRGRPQLVTAA